MADGGVRSLTIDRATQARLVRDLVLQAVRSTSGTRRLSLWALVSAVLGGAVHGWPLALGSAVAACAWVLLVWWRRASRTVRRGLAVGQTVTVGYAASGDLTVSDATGQTWLHRGSAMSVVRCRSLVTVLGRSISFVLPSELLDEADVAFLEGHGDAGRPPTVPDPSLPLGLYVTPAVQAELVASATRVVVTSADFLMSFTAVPILIGFALLAGSTSVVVEVVVLMVVLSWPTWRGIWRTRTGMRRQFPVGRTFRAEVSDDHLALDLPHRTTLMPWPRFRAHRLTGDTVLLREQRRSFARQRTTVLPRALFTPDALARLRAAVPRTF